jgi:SAM-dependent methyltransferase
MSEEHEYILGTDREELERLRYQHQTWVKEGYALWERAGIGSGDTVLDLGCGPGFTSIELAHIVGPRGKVIARDISSRYIEFLRAECERLSLPQLEPSLGPVEEIELARGQLDAAYARWLLCWLPDAGEVLERVARSLKPGGTVVLQDYIDWGAMKLIPPSEPFRRAVDACMQSWRDAGGTINTGDHIPSLANRCGLHVEYFRPIARIGPVGSLEWRWLTQFFRGYLPKIVEQGLLTPEEFDAYLADWDQRAEEGKSYCYTPTMVDVILRKS